MPKNKKHIVLISAMILVLVALPLQSILADAPIIYDPADRGGAIKAAVDLVKTTADAGAGALIRPIVSVIFGAIFHLTGIAAGVAGKLLDISIEYSIQTPVFYEGGIALTGWGICRDLANLGFVFILIFIGIATILQLQNYSYKRLLVGVIIAALLVNFSMTITLMVIDASNLIAMEFLCRMAAPVGGVACSAENISATLSSGIGYQSIIGMDDKGGVFEIMTIYSGGSILLIIVTFVLGAGAFLFIIRTIALMFLIIFSPLAFVAMAIKSGLGTRWWRTLLNQAFFAPIYMFFIFLVTSFFATNYKDTVNFDQIGFARLITNPSVDNVAIAMQFVMACALIIASLVVSKQMGAYGASGAINLGNKWRKAATGYAGKISRRGAVKATGGAAQKIAESKTMQLAAAIPMFGKAARPLTLALNKISAEKTKGDDAKVKSYTNLAPGSLASVLPTLSPSVREKVIKNANAEQLEKTVGKMDEKTQETFGKTIKDDNARDKFAAATNDLVVGAKISNRTDSVTEKDIGEHFEKLSIPQRQKLNYEKLAGSHNNKETEIAMGTLLNKIDSKEFGEMATASRDNVTNISKALKDFGTAKGASGTTGLLNEIRKGNIELAKHLSSSPGSAILLNPDAVKVRPQKGAQKVTTTNPPSPTP